MVDRVKDLFSELKLERKRAEIPKSIITKALNEVDKIQNIPYKKKNYSDIYWGANPYKEDCLIIDLPHIELDKIKPMKKDFVGKAIIYDEKEIKKEGLKYIDKSCVITYNGVIQIVYITEVDDPAIKKATEKLEDLGGGFDKYYPVKPHTFYTPFDLHAHTDAEKKAVAKKRKELLKEDRYYGKNWMDGQIKYYLGEHHTGSAIGAVIAYQPRSPTAYQDNEFMYNLVYSYCALYELEKRYAPAVARWRLELAEEANKSPAIPGVPLNRHPATGMGASLDFASAIHNDSGMDGLSETIFWNKPEKGQKQYFVSPTLGFVFDLTKHNAIILQPPKIPHGTVNSGNHRGYGFVNITKKNLISKTEINQEWYKTWKNYVKSTQSKKDFL
jgi:hypothetical protein